MAEARRERSQIRRQCLRPNQQSWRTHRFQSERRRGSRITPQAMVQNIINGSYACLRNGCGGLEYCIPGVYGNTSIVTYVNASIRHPRVSADILEQFHAKSLVHQTPYKCHVMSCIHSIIFSVAGSRDVTAAAAHVVKCLSVSQAALQNTYMELTMPVSAVRC